MYNKKTIKTITYRHNATKDDDKINTKLGTNVEFVIPLEPTKLRVPSFIDCENQLYEIKPAKHDEMVATSFDFRRYLKEM